jgi:hypothetical protein
MKKHRKLSAVKAGAAALGALAVGATAIGAIAIGAAAIGSLKVGKSLFGKIKIGELSIGKLRFGKIGRRTWIIAEGYIPSSSSGPEPQMLSHETACILNPNKEEANVEITIFFSDKDPVGPYKINIPGE